jgi:hypothetical protein
MTNSTMSGEPGRDLDPALAESAANGTLPVLPSGALPVDRGLACLRAAKSGGLIRRNGANLICPTSEHQNVGWWGTSSWDGRAPDAGKGGPWSLETVAALCELGLLGVKCSPETSVVTALLTRAGAAMLRPVKLKVGHSRAGTTDRRIEVPGIPTISTPNSREGEANG